MINYPQPVEHIKAESYISAFLDSCKDIIIEPQGVFSRNYENDIMSIDTDDYLNKLVLRLSRDSVFNILPESVFFVENKLREIGKKGDREKFKLEEERITKEKQKIKSFFQPFDNAYFKLRFELEQKLNSLSTNRTQLIIDELFDIYDLSSKNQLIQQLIPLIPIASEIRGNRNLLKDVLKVLFYPDEVEMFPLKRRMDSGVVRTILKINIYIEKLSAKQFRDLKKEADEFAAFFYEWFLPVDMGYELKVKDKNERFGLGKAMTLDYNTYL